MPAGTSAATVAGAAAAGWGRERKPDTNLDGRAAGLRSAARASCRVRSRSP